MRRDRLDENIFSELFADAEAGVADQADEIGLAADEFDFLLFAQTEFAKSVCEFRVGAQALDGNDRASLASAQRTNRIAGTLAVNMDVCVKRFAQCSQARRSATWLQGEI